MAERLSSAALRDAARGLNLHPAPGLLRARRSLLSTRARHRVRRAARTLLPARGDSRRPAASGAPGGQWLRLHCGADAPVRTRTAKPMARGLCAPGQIGAVQNTSPVSQFTSRPCVPTRQTPAITRIPTWHHRCLTHPALASTTVRLGAPPEQEADGRSERRTRLGQVAGLIRSVKPRKE